MKLQDMKLQDMTEKYTQTVYSSVLDFAVVFYGLLRQRFNSIATIIVVQVGRTTHANYVVV